MIVSIGPDVGATVLHFEDLTRLHVAVTGSDDAQVDAALRAGGLGYLQDGHAWLSVAALRGQGAAASADWSQRFDAMIDYAVGKGWADADGSHVRAHIERA